MLKLKLFLFNSWYIYKFNNCSNLNMITYTIATMNFIQLLLESEFTILNYDKNNTWRQFVCIYIFFRVVVFDDTVLCKIQCPCNIVDNKMSYKLEHRVHRIINKPKVSDDFKTLFFCNLIKNRNSHIMVVFWQICI